MSKHPRKKTLLGRSLSGRFEPGGEKGPVDDLSEYEILINSVADTDQRFFLQEASRFATTLQYISNAEMPLPPQIAAEVANLKDQSLSVRDRTIRMRRINQQLMEFIDKHDRESSSVRQ